MPISIRAGEADIQLGPEADLAAFLRPGLNTILNLGDTLQGTAGLRLADLPDGGMVAGVRTDQETAWDLGPGVNLSVSFQPDVHGTVRFTKAGSLLSFQNGASEPFAVPVPPGSVYTSIEFHVNLMAGGGLAYSAGQFAVKANLSHEDRFLMAHHRCLPQEMTVSEALRAVFQGFLLPFRADGVARLAENDLLEYEFLGKLGVGFGLSYGFGGALLGGRSTGEIGRSFGNQLASAAIKAKPTVFAGASFAVNYEHEDAFRFVYHRETEAETTLTVFRMDKSALRTKETLGVMLDPGLSFDFKTKAGEALGGAVDRVFANLPDGAKSTAAAKLKETIATRGQGAVDALSQRINGGVNELLKRPAGKVELQVMQERIHTDTALFRFRFATADAGSLRDAMQLAVQGRLSEAVSLPNVSLDPGSFVENEFVRRSSFTIQLFDLWKWTDVVEYVSRVDVIYAGNGVLRLVGLEGVTHRQGIVGREALCDLHFRAEASHKIDATELDSLRVTLVVELLDGKSSQAEETARLLTATEAAPLREAAQRLREFFDSQHNAKAYTICEFNQSTFGAFRADPFDKNKPGPLPHPADAANYTRFVAAVDSVNGQFLGFRSYTDWATFNRTATDQDDSKRIPDRRQPGNIQRWPSTFIQVPESKRNFMRFHSESARHFMNLCESLSVLCKNIGEADTEEEYGRLLQSLNGIVKNDVPPDFIKATLLALMKAAATGPSDVRLAVEGDTLSISFLLAGVQAAGG